MMRLSEQFNDLPVLSIHAGHAIARVSGVIVNPHDLSIIGFHCQPTRSTRQKVLLPQSIREASGDGLVINHEEDLAQAEELVRLKDVLAINFELVGKPVITVSKKKLGKVSSYVIDDLDWQVVKLHVQRPAWKAVFDSSLIIDRAFVVSVSKRAVVVKDASIAATEPAAAIVPTPAA